jgi:hypothetical protein
MLTCLYDEYIGNSRQKCFCREKKENWMFLWNTSLYDSLRERLYHMKIWIYPFWVFHFGFDKV